MGQRIQPEVDSFGSGIGDLRIVQIDQFALGVHQIAGKRGPLAIDRGQNGDRPGSMTRRRENEEIAVAPAERRVVGEHAGNGDVASHPVEVVPHVVEVENAAVSPVILRLGEQVLFMCGYRNRNPSRDRLVIALALFPVVVRMKDPIDVVDTQAGQVVENFPRIRSRSGRTGSRPERHTPRRCPRKPTGYR